MDIKKPKILLSTLDSQYVDNSLYVYPPKKFIPYGIAIFLILFAIIWLYELHKRIFSRFARSKKGILLCYYVCNMLILLGGVTLFGHTAYHNSSPHQPVIIVANEGLWYKGNMYTWQQMYDCKILITNRCICNVRISSEETGFSFKVKSNNPQNNNDQQEQNVIIEKYDLGIDFEPVKLSFRHKYEHQYDAKT